MIDAILRYSIEQRWIVMLCVMGVAGLGLWNWQRLPIDAVPDITNVQVQINTEAPGYTPLEAEQRISFVVETAMGGLPKLDYTRSLSRYGLSQVTVIFQDGTDIYFARQLVNERIQSARDQLPAGITPVIGPISTGLGEIYLWTVEAEDGARKADGSPYTPADLREIQDWIIKPQLRNVVGVTEINSIGGYAKGIYKCLALCENDYKDKKGNGGPTDGTECALDPDGNAPYATGSAAFNACVTKERGKADKKGAFVDALGSLAGLVHAALADANTDLFNENEVCP